MPSTKVMFGVPDLNGASLDARRWRFGWTRLTWRSPTSGTLAGPWTAAPRPKFVKTDRKSRSPSSALLPFLLVGRVPLLK